MTRQFRNSKEFLTMLNEIYHTQKDPAISSFLSVDPREVKTYAHETFQMNAHNSVIKNSQKSKTTQIPTNWRRNKQNVVYPNNGIQFSNKKDETLKYATTWMSLKNIMLSERCQTTTTTTYCIMPYEIQQSKSMRQNKNYGYLGWGQNGSDHKTAEGIFSE